MSCAGVAGRLCSLLGRKTELLTDLGYIAAAGLAGLLLGVFLAGVGGSPSKNTI
jgi:hypothetical protein